MKLRAGNFTYDFPRPVLVMGILNVTPDSFSDGGLHFQIDSALARAERLWKEGADWIDVGGESTRPGADAVSPTEECRRVLPVIEALAGGRKGLVSVDTRNPLVAREAIRLGASIVNDVGAAEGNSEMLKLIADSGAGYVAMHMLGNPATMQIAPTYGSVVVEVLKFFKDSANRFSKLGISQEQLILDPGIGFGKLLEHNLELMASLKRLLCIGRPILLGASRKSFLGQITGKPVGERLSGSLATAVWATLAGIQILRVHDVAETVDAVRTVSAISSRSTEMSS